MSRAFIPNSTQIPDVILDHWMAELSDAEFKVLLYVARRTYGFGKESDNISLNQLSYGIRRKDGSPLDRGTGLSRSGVKKACSGLIEKGLLIRSRNTRPDGREADESTYRLNLFASLPEPGEGVGHQVAYLGHNVAHVGHKRARGRPQNGLGVGHQVAPQETDQQTEQETASREPVAADADLIEALVGKGVFPDVAARLAAEKPDRCRECLAWLPYAKPRTTSGRWLANAIEHDFEPPDQLAKHQANEKKARGTVQANTKAPEKAQVERGEAITTRLRVAYSRLLKTQSDAITAFEGFLRSERERTAKLAATLSEKGQREFLRNADSEEYRLAVFERWLNGDGRRWCKPNGEPQTLAVGGHAGIVSENSEFQLQHVR